MERHGLDLHLVGFLEPRITMHGITNMKFEWMFKKLGGETWTGLFGSKKGQVAVTCECGNEPSNSMKWGYFLD